MHRYALQITLLLIAVDLVPASQLAAAEVSYDLGLYSAYVWRGITETDGAVFQPAATIAHDSGFSFNIWGNLDLDDVNGLSGDFQEIDLTLSYEFGKGRWQYEAGLIEYLLPNGAGASTREFYFAAGIDSLLQPTITLYYDFDEVNDLYATLGLESKKPVSGDWSYSVGLLAGWASEAFSLANGGSGAGWFNGDVSLSLVRSLTRGSIAIFAAYTKSIDQVALPNQPVDFWGGISLALSF